MSRGTGMRVFTAMPVIVRDQVAGVVYASRTPSNVFKYLYEQRGKVALAILFMIVPTLLIGFLFHRTITEPMRELIERTNLIGKGDRDALRPLKRHGTSEFARLSQSFLDMARRLNTRSSFISTFATHVSHELKSPLTSIQGAAELLRDDVDAPSHGRRGPAQVSRQHHRRRRPADQNLGPPARFRPRGKSGCGRRRQTVRHRSPACVRRSPALDLRAGGELDTPMRISEENATIIFSNLADNAMRHGSSTLDLIRDAAGKSAADQSRRQRRRRLAQQPDADLRQLFHHAPRQRRHRHGARHRARHAGCPWRRDPPADSETGHRVRADDPAWPTSRRHDRPTSR